MDFLFFELFIIRVLYQSLIDKQCRSRQRIPLIFTITLGGIKLPIVCGTSEEPPLALREFVETTQVCTAAATFIQELNTPLAQHPIHIESGEATARVCLSRLPSRRHGTEVTFTYFIHQFFGLVGLSGTHFTLGKAYSTLRSGGIPLRRCSESQWLRK